MQKLSSIVAVALLPVSLALGCGGGGSGPVLTYSITDGEQNLAAIPWPSDTLRDSTGHIPLSTLPISTSAPNLPDLLDDLKTDQDGFGATSGAFFPVGRFQPGAVADAAVDPKSGSVDASTLTGNVHLLPLACPDGSVTASTPELPVITHLRATDKPQRIYARAEQGIVLQQQCTYAYVVTTGVKTDKGALGPADDMAALLSDKTPAARLQAAYTVFAPLRARLATGAITTKDVAAATVFTVHSLTPDYVAARTILTSAAAPTAAVQYVFARTPTADDAGSLDELFGVAAAELPGDDNVCATTPAAGVPGCQAHGNIDYVVQGTYQTVDYLGGTKVNAMGIDGTNPGPLKHDASGKPLVKDMITVPFTLVIPASTTPADLTALRIAVVQHGLGADRTSMLTVANTLAGKGIASILIDLPFHGARRTDAVDMQRNMTLGTGPDGFGESSANPDLGFFDAAGNSAIGLPIANPRAIRGAFFQATNDIEQEFRMIESGDLSAIATKEPRLATLKLDTSHEVYVGESFGSMIGTLVAAFQPGLVGTVLDVGGGGTVFPLLINSATFEPLFSTLLNGAVGATPNAVDPLDTDFTYNLAEWLLEEGDALAYSPYVFKQQYSTAAHACNVLQISAFKDELVPNPANLALARGIGLQPLQLSDGGAPDLTGWPEATAAMGMLSANVDGVTGAFIQFNPAVHTLMTERNGEQMWDLSMGPPFAMLNPPIAVMDPTDRVNQIVGSFIDAASKGTPPTVQ